MRRVQDCSTYHRGVTAVGSTAPSQRPFKKHFWANQCDSVPSETACRPTVCRPSVSDSVQSFARSGRSKVGHEKMMTFSAPPSRVPAGSPSRGGTVVVYVKDLNQPSLPTPFYSVLVCASAFMALSTVFHSINSLDNSLLSHSVLPVLILPYWSFQLYTSV